MNLELYLSHMWNHRPLVLMVGEAPGYRGSALTGVPFASEHTLMSADSPSRFLRTVDGFQRIPSSAGPLKKESTSSVIWTELDQLEKLPILWAAYPHHPHRPGLVKSNRMPGAEETSQGRAIINELVQSYKVQHIVALGNVAASVLVDNVRFRGKIRHPAHGGIPVFRNQCRSLAAL